MVEATNLQILQATAGFGPVKNALKRPTPLRAAALTTVISTIVCVGVLIALAMDGPGTLSDVTATAVVDQGTSPMLLILLFVSTSGAVIGCGFTIFLVRKEKEELADLSDKQSSTSQSATQTTAPVFTEKLADPIAIENRAGMFELELSQTTASATKNGTLIYGLSKERELQDKLIDNLNALISFGQERFILRKEGSTFYEFESSTQYSVGFTESPKVSDLHKNQNQEHKKISLLQPAGAKFSKEEGLICMEFEPSACTKYLLIPEKKILLESSGRKVLAKSFVIFGYDAENQWRKAINLFIPEGFAIEEGGAIRMGLHEDKLQIELRLQS